MSVSLLGTWYRLGHGSKIRFCRDQFLHSRICPFTLSSRRSESYVHETYQVEGEAIVFQAVAHRFRNGHGPKTRRVFDPVQESRYLIAELTEDTLTLVGTFNGREIVSQFVRARP